MAEPEPPIDPIQTSPQFPQVPKAAKSLFGQSSKAKGVGKGRSKQGPPAAASIPPPDENQAIPILTPHFPQLTQLKHHRDSASDQL